MQWFNTALGSVLMAYNVRPMPLPLHGKTDQLYGRLEIIE